MLLELELFDAKGIRSGRVQLELYLDKNSTSGNWELQEMLEGTGWAGISAHSKGKFHAKEWGVLWLMEPGQAGERNILILRDTPMNEAASKSGTSRSGHGRIYDPVNAKFKDGTVKWSMASLSPVRKRVLEIIERHFPPYPTIVPTPNFFDATKPGAYTGGVTNCGVLPGKIASQLGYHLGGSEINRIPSNEFIDVDPTDNNPGKTAVFSPIVGAWTYNWGSKSTSFPTALERARNLPPGTILKKYYREPEMKKKDARPKPGDFYILCGWLEKLNPSTKKKEQIFGITHVGVIIDAVGSIWTTADSGQNSVNAIAYKRRKFDLEAGTLNLTPMESVWPDGGNRYLDAWVDIDQLFAGWVG